MLIPSQVKHRKWRKRTGRNGGIEIRGTELTFGQFGLKAQGTAWVSSRQIEAGRRSILRHLTKGGKIWIRIFPDKPITRKGTEVPMGGGKGAVDHYVAVVRPGRIIFELDGVPEDAAKDALRVAGSKFPMKTVVIKR